MNVNHIELFNSKDELFCTLGFRDPKSLNPYVMKAIVGLDATEITPKFYGLGATTRQKYHNLSIGSRDITLKIGLNPNFFESETFSDLRDLLYRNIVSTRTGEVRMFFKDGPGPEGVRCYIYGFVTKFESSLEGANEVQITIRCLDPMLRGLPITIPTPEIEGFNITITDNVSTAPHTFQWEVEFLDDCLQFAIFNVDELGDWWFNIVPGVIDGDTGFLSGDTLRGRGQIGLLVNQSKELVLSRGGDDIPIADKVQQGSLWPLIFPGVNVFSAVCTGEYEWLSIEYSPEFWGV